MWPSEVITGRAIAFIVSELGGYIYLSSPRSVASLRVQVLLKTYLLSCFSWTGPLNICQRSWHFTVELFVEPQEQDTRYTEQQAKNVKHSALLVHVTARQNVSDRKEHKSDNKAG